MKIASHALLSIAAAAALVVVTACNKTEQSKTASAQPASAAPATAQPAGKSVEDRLMEATGKGPDSALKLAEAELPANPKNAKVAEIAARSAYELKQYKKAEDYATKCLELAKNKMECLVTRGNARDALGNQDGHIADLTALMESGYDSVAALHDRGSAYRAKGDIKSARKDWERALKLDPNKDESFLAFAEFDEGHRFQAIKIMKAMAKKNPAKKPKYDYYLATMFAKGKDAGRAISFLKEALQGGYNNFQNIATDPDLNPIRKNPQFVALGKKYGF